MDILRVLSGLTTIERADDATAERQRQIHPKGLPCTSYRPFIGILLRCTRKVARRLRKE
jgi:hypothetical protein